MLFELLGPKLAHGVMITQVVPNPGIAESPLLKEHLDAIGFVPVGNTPDEFAAVIKVESERWANVIRAANLKAEQ